jgi:arylsulfatase
VAAVGDDIGWFNVSAYNLGVMGYRTPNIDRIAKEGALFTDWYGQQSCTAGRAAFITGQSPIRTGLTKVGLPGADLGLGPKDPSVADVLKSLGYATGQFGKNHLGDRDEHLPTMHGFDEFFGNLYHLNAEEEPENPDYPKDPKFREKFGPRGVLKCKADGKGGQTIENTGPLTKKRMETVDEEFLAAAKDFIKRRHSAGGPWFCYFNSTRIPRPVFPSDSFFRCVKTCMTGMSASCSRWSTNSASPTTRSSCTPPTTAPNASPGPTAARPHSRARRRPTGKAVSACRAPSAGPA